MARQRSTQVLWQMRTLFGVGRVGTLSDGELLDRFARDHREGAEAAFATLVERHGPMVLRVCRGVLGDSPEVHDAFQATFLVLVRKAGTLWVRDSLGPWLHGVALRIATKAKVAAARRRVHERRGAEAAEASRLESTPDDLAAILHAEVERLPAKYRAPIVLCYLEGLTHEGAGAALGWPVGTVSGRLARARDLLRTRLVRRGLVPSVEALSAVLTAERAEAALPDSLVRGVTALVAERAAGIAPATVAVLAEESLRMMALAKLRTASILVALGLVALGLAGTARGFFNNEEPERVVGNEEPPQPVPVALAVADEPEGDAPALWPAGVEVKGRVVDHRGEPLAGADVLLLRDEKLTVYADTYQSDGRVRYSFTPRPVDPTAAVKTDDQGRFTLRRPGSDADRIVVVSERMLLWEVLRKHVKNHGDVEITLPVPGSLSIRADIPGKPASEEFWIVGRPGERVDWQSNCVYYRGIKVPNPGVRIVEPLPPAQYAIERINFTQTAVRTNLMTPCERRLLSVRSGKTTETVFDRKSGRPIEGRVLGLEGLKLRYAMVSIGYPGPEEKFEPGEKLSRIFTHFDVIPITSDGRFTTPPLPAGEYEFRVTGMLASTPAGDGQPYDIQSSTRIKVPASGELPRVEVAVKLNGPPTAGKLAIAQDPKTPRLEIRARDASGAPVKDFEAQLFAPPWASKREAIGTDGLAVITESELKDWHQGDLIVYAPGYASTVREIGPITGLTKVDVVLERGTKVRLRVRDHEGRAIAPGIMPLPQVYLARHRGDVAYLLVSKDPEIRVGTVAATNFLNLRPDPEGDFAFHVRAEESTPLYFAFSHPDVLLYYEKGPVSASDLASGVWDIKLPAPASLDLALKSPSDASGQSLFAAGYYSLSRSDADSKGARPVMDSGSLQKPDWRASLHRLAPGPYSLHLQTTPRNATGQAAGLEASPGVYFDLREINLKPGEPTSVVFDPPPFDPNAWRGTRSATVLVSSPSGRPPGDQPYKVSYTLPHYGYLRVAEGRLGSEGRIELKDLAPSGEPPDDGQYVVHLGDTYLGKFAVEDRPGMQEFRLRTPLAPGDLAGGEAVELATGATVRIDEFRGRIVLLEFWATWCGPCREPMQRFVDLGKRRAEAWRDDVALVAISIDDDRDALAKYVLQNGLTTVRQLWSPREKDKEPGSACGEYDVWSVPTSLLIGRDGRILWRGHPSSLEAERKIEELLARPK